MYRLTVKGLSFEAAALILVGFVAGLMFDSWRVVIAVQVAFVAFEFAGGMAAPPRWAHWQVRIPGNRNRAAAPPGTSQRHGLTTAKEGSFHHG